MSNIQINPYNFAAPSIGAWKEFGRVTGSGALSVSVADSPYYMVLNSGLNWGSGDNSEITFNSDGGVAYAFRYSKNGSSPDSEGIDRTRCYDYYGVGSENQIFALNYIGNVATQEKLGIANSVGEMGASLAPSKDDIVYKWANTSNAISSIDFPNPNGAGTGSEIVVLGYDETATPADSFWKELASVDLSGGAAGIIDSGTIPVKKYLWVQLFEEATGGTIQTCWRFNSDSSNNYGFRYAENGGDYFGAVANQIGAFTTNSTNAYTSMFITQSNNYSKLAIGEMVLQNAVGTANAPTSVQFVGKWSTAPSTITSIQATDLAGTGQYATGTFMKVWGSD
tara:strand:- start:569 stop:1582 length:1014 start_codon:yes stop_codon:yes gene_type:complete